MPARFVSIEQHEFEDFMEDNEFACINDEQTRQELVFVRQWHGATYMMKIYSSIVPAMEGSRGCGKDAIRVMVFILEDGEYRCVWKGKRVHRTMGWKNNLQQRIDYGMKVGCYERNHECQNCGAPMVGREGPRGFFYGCSMYGATKCRYTENV